MGSFADLEKLILAVHMHGMKIICDLPFNHISNKHPWFIEARANPNSPKRKWFTFLSEDTYLGWWGNTYFPELNLENIQVQQMLWSTKNSVMDFWLGKGFDGYLTTKPSAFSLVTWNASNKKQKAVLSVPYAHLYSEIELVDVFSGKTTHANSSFVGVELEPWECALWRIREGNKGNYRFFKEWNISE